MNRSMTRCEDRPRGLSRARLEHVLSPLLATECRARLWAEAWEWGGVAPATLWSWCQTYGHEMAALAVAARLTELQMRRHLSDALVPDRAVLEMLADLNCFPFATPAARSLALEEVGA
jgi:hypothetical protein